MVRAKDPLWVHAEELNKQFKCKHCQRIFAGGLTRLRFHLSGLRGNDIDICTLVPQEVQHKICESLGKHPSKRGRIESRGTTDSVGGIPCNPIRGGMYSQSYQSTMPEMVKKMDKSQVDDLLAIFFIQNNLAFNIVQQKSFIDLVKGIAEFGPAYKLPSYTTFRTKLIPNAKKRVDEYVEEVKKSWEITGCSIMSDTWSDMKGRCFINFIAHCPRGAVFLQSVEISEEKKTCLFLSELSTRVIDKIGPEHVVQFISDNASNYETCGNMLLSKYTSMYKTKCAAHGIQLLFKDIYEKVSWIQNVVDNAKSIQSYMYRHTIITALMRKNTKGRELRKPCTTRFASNFLVVQAALSVENELRVFVASQEWRDLSYSKSREAKHVTQLIQDSSFWSQARELIQALECLVRILRLVDGDGSTAGYLFQAMELARDGLKKKSDKDNEKYGLMLTLFETRRKENIIQPVHAFAATLDPIYVSSPDFKQTWEMKEGFYFIYNNVIPANKRDQFTKQYRDYLLKPSSLFNDATCSIMKTSHPRLWWEYCGDVLPTLQKYAIRILSQPCSSSSCERNWSAFEAAQTKKRNRLSPDMLSLLVYCRMNTLMMQNLEQKMFKDADPIDLSKLVQWPDYWDDDEPCPPIADELGSGETPLGEASEGNAGGIVPDTSLSDVCLTYVDDDADFFDLTNFVELRDNA